MNNRHKVLIKKYFEEQSFVDSTIESFNNFLEKELQEIINENKEVEPTIIPPDVDEFKIKFDKIWVTKPEITEADGSKRNIYPSEARLRKITYSADTMPCESLIVLGKDSDVLIHDATFSKSMQEQAIEKKHSTSVDAANDAKLMNAKQLILTHISSRYQEEALNLLEEAKEIFPNTVLAEDGMVITVK